MITLKRFIKSTLIAIIGCTIFLYLACWFDQLAHSAVEPSTFSFFWKDDPPKARPYEQAGIMGVWNVTKGLPSTIVAVIDTGADVSHPALEGAFVEGVNFVTRKPGSFDDQGHGTHISGIIHTFAPNVKILPLKFYSDANPGSVNVKNTVAAISYAVDHGAKIINYSGGGPEFNEDELLALKRAEAKGVLVVAAAGNEHQLLAGTYYPASYFYRLKNLIVVGALDTMGNKAATSNFGTGVDIFAPGENIFSTLPGGRYGYMSGTSQATAFVTGAAALLMAKFPGITPAQIRARLMEMSSPSPWLKEYCASGRLNAIRALLGNSEPIVDR